MRIFDCIDAGTENCPCYLAQTGDCLTCSRLQGKEHCDCDWRGVCIYNEFIQGGKEANNIRKDFNARILEKKQYLDDLAVFVVDVGKGFALKASKPGSYVFVKANLDPAFYNVPISVMKSDVENGALHLAIKAISAKTKLLLKEQKELTLRGVYRNGILNLKSVIGKRGTIEKNNKMLLITKGVGFAPAVLLSEWVENRARTDFLIDIDKISGELVLDYMPKEVSGVVKEIDLRDSFANEKEYARLKRNIESEQYESILALTSDYYIEKFGKLAAGLTPSPIFACGNNFQICCGEGICGACSRVNAEGVTFKMCKCNAMFTTK